MRGKLARNYKMVRVRVKVMIRVRVRAGKVRKPYPNFQTVPLLMTLSDL